MLNKVLVKKLLTDIQFWIVLFFLIRMIGITNPPLEIGHNRRQSLTNMVARNFLTVDAGMKIDFKRKTYVLGVTAVTVMMLLPGIFAGFLTWLKPININRIFPKVFLKQIKTKWFLQRNIILLRNKY
jgi:hypothetical protein